MSKWREDQILVICPGSQTTLGQLGINDLPLPQHRFPTRMFRDPDSPRTYVPYRIYKRKKATATNGTGEGGEKSAKEDEYEYIEDRDSTEGAIYPMVRGHITNMPAFLAFLGFVHNSLTTSHHNTPIVLVAQPQWSRVVCEIVTKHIFEKTKTPGLCMAHSAIATLWGFSPDPYACTIVDIGYEKVDVTCINSDAEVKSYYGCGYVLPARGLSGGEVFTRSLLDQLKDKGFTYDMAEQLKKSPICEVLPWDMELPTEDGSATTSEGLRKDEFKPAAAITGSAAEGNGVPEDSTNDDGVLDVANIVTSGNTREFLAKKEKEKAERAKTKKGKGQEPDPTVAKPPRLANSKKVTNTFHYEELVHEDIAVNALAKDITNTSIGEATANGESSASARATEPNGSLTERRTRRVGRDIEVGLERFTFAEREQIDRIAGTIYMTIQDLEHSSLRSQCWDKIAIVGNGSRIRGLKENIMETLIGRYLISPSTATIFSSELPSNVATPTGTGSQTPTGSAAGQIPTTSSVNPLLMAATTSNLGNAAANQTPDPGSNSNEAARQSQHGHSQTPTSIKTAPPPTYLTEWTKYGFEEATFLGACILGRTVFTQPPNGDNQYFPRMDYNKFGPRAFSDYGYMNP